MAKGRPKNENKALPLEEQRQLALEKHRCGEHLTLDETALAMWDPSREKKPMSVMGIQKIEMRALAKLRAAVAKRYGWKSLDDVLETRRGFATPCENRLAGDE